MECEEKKFQQHNINQIDYFSQKNNPIKACDLAPYKLRQIDEMIWFSNITTSDTILEIGCGSGNYTLSLAERGFNIEGLDLTPFLLEQLKERNCGRFTIPLYCSDILNHPPELNNRYDAIIAFHVLHHVHDIFACFKALAEMVKMGGSITIMEPSALSPAFYAQILLAPNIKWKSECGIVNIRKSIIFDASQKAGLVNFQLIRFGFFPPFIANKRWGYKLDKIAEKVPFLYPFLPFLLFKCKKL